MFINTIKNKYPYSLQELRQDNSEVSFPLDITPEIMAEYGVYPVTVADKPTYNIATENITLSQTPELLNGVWVVSWVVSAKTADEIVAYAKSLVPNSITPRQARLALLQATLLDEVETMLANDKAMQIWWEYSLEIERSHAHIIAMGTALGLTERQLDDLFILAGTL